MKMSSTFLDLRSLRLFEISDCLNKSLYKYGNTFSIFLSDINRCIIYKIIHFCNKSFGLKIDSTKTFYSDESRRLR